MMFEKYEDIEQFRAEQMAKPEKELHRFTGFMEEPVKMKISSKPKKKKQKKSTDKEISACAEEICEDLICNLTIGHLSNIISPSLGILFILPIREELCDLIDEMGMYRHKISAKVLKFFDKPENKELLDDRIDSLLPATATKRFGCEKIKVVFDPIEMEDSELGTAYVEVYACPYLT